MPSNKQNTKTTHRKNLTKNKTPLCLAISKKPKIQLQITNHAMMISDVYNTTHTPDVTNAPRHGRQPLRPVKGQ